jgi:mannose-6-phosphate isomerase-like protein (cupin superfamily)
MSLRTKVIETTCHDSKNDQQLLNGYVVSLYKDWEGIFEVEPKQVYLNVCFPGEWKGPHLHMNRWDHFITIRGNTRYVIKYGASDYEEIDVNVENGKGIMIVVVPPAIPCLVINTGKDDAWFLNLPNPAWHPDNQDNHPISYDDYPGWEKLKKNRLS